MLEIVVGSLSETIIATMFENIVCNLLKIPQVAYSISWRDALSAFSEISAIIEFGQDLNYESQSSFWPLSGMMITIIIMIGARSYTYNYDQRQELQ